MRSLQQLKAYKRQWYLANRARLRRRSKAAYKKNRSAILARVKRYTVENREKVAAYKKVHSARNRVRLAAYYQRHYRKNKRRILDRNRAYRRRNYAAVARGCREWRLANPHKKRASHARRRASMKKACRRGASPKFIGAFYETATRLTRCTGIPFHVDHIKPLSKGGIHHERNLQVLPGKLNMRKHAKWPPPSIEALTHPSCSAKLAAA